LAIAHIEAECELEAVYAGPARAPQLYSASAVADIHRSMFERLPKEERVADGGVSLEPGQFRSREVTVGRHVAPAAQSIPLLLERWATFYGGVRRGEGALLALAASHHRLGWIHPFIDGNGRFMRGMLNLQTLERRIAACLTFEQETLRSGVRIEALRPLHYLFLSGLQIERGEFKRMTGLGDRTAVSLLTALVTRGLLRSDTPQGKVRFGLPLHALRFYFPALWPEAEAD